MLWLLAQGEAGTVMWEGKGRERRRHWRNQPWGGGQGRPQVAQAPFTAAQHHGETLPSLGKGKKGRAGS